MNSKKKLSLILITQNQGLIDKLRQRMSMTVLAADNAAYARALITEIKPSCVIIDFSIGQADAMDLADELRATQRETMTIGLLDRVEKLLPAAS